MIGFRGSPWLCALCLGLMSCAAVEEEEDLGVLERSDKADRLLVRKEFSLKAATDRPASRSFRFYVARRLAADLLDFRMRQEGESQPAQMVLKVEGEVVAEGRTSQAPVLKSLVPDEGGLRYSIVLLNHGSQPTSGTLEVVVRSPRPELKVLFNQPDCEDGCADRSGGMRQAVVDSILAAQQTIDLAVYGINEPAVVRALCQVAREGVRVRVVGDDDSLKPDDSRSYWPALFGPEGLQDCGALVEVVRSNGIMHNKFYVIDAEGLEPLIITGSTNQTVDCLDRNHNHMIFISHPDPGMVGSFQAEFDQLFRRCRDFESPDGERGWDCTHDKGGKRLTCIRQTAELRNTADWECSSDGQLATCSRPEEKPVCTECVPSCTRNVSDEGPWKLGEQPLEIMAYFSPNDDPLKVLRGSVKSVKVASPPPECSGVESSCACRKSGSQFLCDYCAGSEPGFPQGREGHLDWGLMGGALGDGGSHRVLMSMYAATDQCFALAFARAAGKGARALAIWDKVNAASPYTRDDYLCGAGVESYVSNWANGSPLVRNHNKLIVIDDVVFTGSMNISDSGADLNNENTLVIRGAGIADQLARYVETEASLLRRRGVTALDPKECVASDLVDNDSDGLVDEDDPDHDSPPAEGS
jgi:phosphatidylserine/phosphatidylglycerophosphate/cardiolipin synthase-like enzyme